LNIRGPPRFPFAVCSFSDFLLFPIRMFFRVLFPLTLLAAAASAAPLDDAIALFKAKQYPSARAALEQIATAEPANAAAAYYLGQTLLRRGDTKALEEAVPWLAKAVALDPKNATYLADFGGASLQLASRTSSLSAATKGRDAMEKSLVLNPENLDAREGLFQFYQRAPWPIGSSSKAATQLEEIRRRDADRATVLSVNTKVSAKDYAAAFRMLDEALAKNPDNYAALYFYGRTASISDLNLAAGLANLEKCLTLPPPGAASPTHSNVWNRIGNLHEKLQHPAEARRAYEEALKLDPDNKPAADALAKLR
jgi:tetratricopeptide (TPR) repeat protein